MLLPIAPAAARRYSRGVEAERQCQASSRTAPVPETPQPEAASLRDAAGIVARTDADEAAATEARLRYRAEGIAPVEPDEAILPLLDEGELPFAVRRSAALDRREPKVGAHPSAGIAGDLYVTSRRLILVGRHTVTFDLADIAEAVLSGELLLLVMRDGSGVALDVDQPRLLRVQIAAAHAPART